MMIFPRFTFLLLMVLLTPTAAMATPRLVLQITIDQLRADMPNRVRQHWGTGGFRYLYDDGLVYSNAYHAHANTETIVGHTTLATGAYPSVHGMVGNLWYDRDQQRVVYNIEDPAYALLSANADVDRNTEIDPTQRAAKNDGRSPGAIRVSTLADEIALAGNGKARVFGISVKDRGAVAMAGHAGKAFWFSKASGEFVTSNYYYDRYPKWLADWNGARPAHQYSQQQWSLSLPESAYHFADEAEWETDFPGYGNTFPHAFGKADGKYFTTLLTLSPVGDALTADFAKALIDAEQLGTDNVTDYLSVSFSSVDYVGHLFGPASRESEDNLIRLDRTLADLLGFIDQKIGLQHVLIVLSSDHGSPEVAGRLNAFNVPAGNIPLAGWPQAEVNRALQTALGLSTSPIQAVSWPYVYLDHALLAREGIDRLTAANAVAAAAASLPGVLEAVVTSDLPTDVSRPDYLARVANNQAAGRSGDIYLVSMPHWFVADFDGLNVASAHGSPWTYDTHVPVIFAGNGIRPGQVNRQIETVDVASSIAARLGIKPPSGAVGRILPEIMKDN